jgi:hypothetical protein
MYTEKEKYKIAYNCRKATFLIEKRLISTLTIPENVALQLHLDGCLVCRLYEHQSRLINRMAPEALRASGATGVKLNEQFKLQMQKRLEQELKRTNRF